MKNFILSLTLVAVCAYLGWFLLPWLYVAGVADNPVARYAAYSYFEINEVTLECKGYWACKALNRKTN